MTTTATATTPAIAYRLVDVEWVAFKARAYGGGMAAMVQHKFPPVTVGGASYSFNFTTGAVVFTGTRSQVVRHIARQVIDAHADTFRRLAEEE